MALDLTQDQKNTGAANFAQAAADLARQQQPADDARAAAGLPPTRRTFLKTAAATGAVMPVAAAVYFGYDQWKGLKYEPPPHRHHRHRRRGRGAGRRAQPGVHPDRRGGGRPPVQPGAHLHRRREGREARDAASPRKGLTHIYGEAEAKGIRRYTSVDALLKDAKALKLDAVIIATPLFTHHTIAIACMNEGLHVLCEKLMARTDPQ